MGDEKRESTKVRFKSGANSTSSMQISLRKATPIEKPNKEAKR